MLGLGRANHRAHPAQARRRALEAAGEPVDEGGQALVQGRLGRRQVLHVGGPGVAGPDQDEDAGTGSLRRRDQGLQRIDAEQRVGGEGVRVEPRTGPQGVGVSPTRPARRPPR